MLENIDFAIVNWSRAQFALTAMFHWVFVPLTLGLGFLNAFTETIYYKTGNPEWKKLTKFWMKLFGINFACGVATGLILEFQFGTNWSNYSWFVGDIFGAPLAIEGIIAFFMESTFVAVMFFGWEKVSKRFHLASTWLTAIGANLSAVWILVANGWMQNPVGTAFNPDTARNEMTNFWEIIFSETALNKFFHSTTCGFVLAAVFVIGVSSWFLLKNREILFAKRSIVVAAVFGLISSIIIVVSGDKTTKHVAEVQPMKLAAMESLYEGTENAPLVAFGILSGKETEKNITADSNADFLFKIEIPGMLSFLSFNDSQSFVAGIKDLVLGNEERGILSYTEKIERGHEARQTLLAYKNAKEENPNSELTAYLKEKLNDQTFINEYFTYFGYAPYYDENPEILQQNAFKMVPPISLTFYSFRIMVMLGFYFVLLFVVVLFLIFKDKLHTKRWLLLILIFSIPLPYIAGMAGWIVAEVGRQPWAIQDLMSVVVAISKIETSSVMITFSLFAVLFFVLFIAEMMILLKQIKIGPKIEEENSNV
ncbi:MAG: cytochrome ubiquinol oxidase subunit I [Marinilabiliaceae bacterium]|nr:cytochrome ubiquinol oxidase subunit I [Marinilabiliaceae bacterium]